MIQYLKNPIPVNAFRWQNQSYQEMPDWARAALDHGKIARNGLALSVYTEEGTMRANPGDWVLQADDGRVWPTDHDYFTRHYTEMAPATAIV